MKTQIQCKKKFKCQLIGYLIVLSLFPLIIRSQNQISLIDKGSNKAIELKKLAIHVYVVENIATTTFEMDFYNKTSRVLEGELNFPLGEGITVSKFALDVNGEMRDGVVVEKQRATQAFEAVTRRKIDPGLVEMTKGNNFKARVYPIFGHKFKKAIISFEQELEYFKDHYLYNLPINFKQEIPEFSFHIEVENSEVIKQSNKNDKLFNFKYDAARNSYISDFSAEKFMLDKSLTFLVEKPIENNICFTYQGKVVDSSYFYINTIPEKEIRKKTKPKKISIVWDASLSGMKRDTLKELALLAKYFKWIKNVEVELMSFSIATEEVKKFNIQQGEWSALKKSLSEIAYDGASCLGCLDFKALKADEILFFSDGVSNFYSDNISLTKIPVIAINSHTIANHNYLNYIADKTSGCYINLNTLTINDAIGKMTTQKKQFIRAESAENCLYDMFPNRPSSFDYAFSISGKMAEITDTLKLHFGFGNEVTETKTFIINNQNPELNDIAERMWAQKKIAELSIFEQENEEKITRFGKKFSIVTKNTSLIVLDNVEDYVTYEIKPPASLLAEYNVLMKRKENKEASEKESRLEYVHNLFSANIELWEETINYNEILQKQQEEKKELPKEDIKSEIEEIEEQPEERQRNRRARYNRRQRNNSIPRRTYSEQQKTVTGTVREKSGTEIPGVNVVLRGTVQGTITDLDGNFSLTIPVNGVLQFSFVGYTTLEIDAENDKTFNVTLQTEEIGIEDVVVVGYGTQRKSDITGSIVSISGGNSHGNYHSSRNSRSRRNNRSDRTSQMTEAISTSASGLKIEETSFHMNISSNESTIKINAWQSNAGYMKELKKSNTEHLYHTYLKIKPEHIQTPSFYFDVASYFYSQGKNQEALRVISNLSELELENHEILRSLGRKLSEFGFHKHAIYIFSEVLKIRSFEPQSYRDLGLAYASDKQYLKALKTLNEIIEKNWDISELNRLRGAEVIVLHEMNNIISKMDTNADISFIDKRFIKNLTYDIRIVIDWDANDTDIDLWVTDPLYASCSYQNKRTKIGGKISNDLTQGYGPEEFVLKYAVPGKYIIKAHYYGNSKQTIIGPVTVRGFLYTNYGKKNEECKEISIQIEKKDSKKYNVGKMEFI